MSASRASDGPEHADAMTTQEGSAPGSAVSTAGTRLFTPRPAATACDPHPRDVAFRAQTRAALREEEQRIAVQIAALEQRFAADGARMNRDARTFLKLLLQDRRGALLSVQRRALARF